MSTLRRVPRLLLVLLIALWQPLCLCQAGHAAGHHHASEHGAGPQAEDEHHEHSAAEGQGDEASEHDHHGEPGDHGDGHQCNCDAPVFLGADKDPLLKKSSRDFVAIESRPFATGIQLLPTDVLIRPRAAEWRRPPRSLSILYCSFLI